MHCHGIGGFEPYTDDNKIVMTHIERTGQPFEENGHLIWLTGRRNENNKKTVSRQHGYRLETGL
jgi:hypothetical protein